MAALKTLHRNVPYVRQQMGALLGNTSITVKAICLVMVVGYVVSFWPSAVLMLTVTPGYVFPPGFRIWTVFTHWLVEFHLWEVLVDIVTVGLCGKLIEPLWGKQEMMTFFALMNVSVALVGAFFYLILYMSTFNTDVLFKVHIHGLAGYIAGVSVVVKQMMPDHIVARTPLGKLTNRNVPLCLSLLSLLLWLVGVLEGTYATQFVSGVLVSWLYLRFYQRHSNGTRGDMNENFTFASFFPTVLQPPISVCSRWVHGALVSLRLCRKPVRKYDVSAPSAITISLPGTDSHDAERRRQIALKALNERLSKTEVAAAAAASAASAAAAAAASATAWPSLDEEEPASKLAPAPANESTTVQVDAALP